MPNADSNAHYGVINLHNVNQDLLEEAMQNGDYETWDDKFFRHLDAAKSSMDTAWESYEEGSGIKDGLLSGVSASLEWCQENIDMMGRDDIAELVCKEFDARVYIDQNVMMVTWSKHTTQARLCSPCYPDAGDLDSLAEYGEKTYCLPKEWTNA